MRSVPDCYVVIVERWERFARVAGHGLYLLQPLPTCAPQTLAIGQTLATWSPFACPPHLCAAPPPDAVRLAGRGRRAVLLPIGREPLPARKCRIRGISAPRHNARTAATFPRRSRVMGASHGRICRDWTQRKVAVVA